MTNGGFFKSVLLSSSRYALMGNIIKGFLILSFLLRIVFMVWQHDEVSWNSFDVLHTLLFGLFFDIGTCSFIFFPALLYFTLLPNRFCGSLLDRVWVYFFLTLTIILLIFTFFAEITFWDEFHSRFNFIAVDYLIYTFEVVKNIQESYPLPLLIAGVAFLTFIAEYILWKRGVFRRTFTSMASMKTRMLYCLIGLVVIAGFIRFVKNSDAEWSPNRYNNEISKAGIYSFFGAFRNNQLKYEKFYETIDNNEAFGAIRSTLKADTNDTRFLSNDFSIARNIATANEQHYQPNVVFILMESMSAEFMKEFGNTKNLTPNLDSYAQNGLLFTNLYATGTRTVRGMEAVTLCIPPTPGQSIVKRPDNHDLFTIGSVFDGKGYKNNFFYGGDGYFDNMNSYFGGNGFDIYDRGRGSVLADDIKTERHIIKDNEVTFENAWGICDEDIYNKMLRVADDYYKKGQPFFNFVMSTSNHRPYTYPENKIDIPSGKNRDGAVKYSDYALGEMMRQARTKPWFSNTVFVFVADHCASSAGKDEIDIANYHIPAIIYNLKGADKVRLEKQCSQIDIFPTLFSKLGWQYDSNFFGENVAGANYEERALLGTYRKLALMKNNRVMVLSDQKKDNNYAYDATLNNLIPKSKDKALLKEAISWYQTADFLFNNKLLKEESMGKK